MRATKTKHNFSLVILFSNARKETNWKNIIQKAPLIAKIEMRVYIIRKISDARE